MIHTIVFKDDRLSLLDQRKLPLAEEYFECKTYKDVEFAIRDMVVRGAPAIGIAAGYGAYLAALEFVNSDDFDKEMEKALDILNKSRPTAVNLMWAVDKMKKLLEDNKDRSNEEKAKLIKKLAIDIEKLEEEMSLDMSKNGAELVKKGDTILTHCNTGSLATSGLGTALGVIKYAHEEGKDIKVYADETRPRLQGARLTAYELDKEKIPFKLISDSVAATLIRDGKIDFIVVGADRIAKNGDTANKIGTFMLSIVAKEYKVPFYIAAPSSTIDFDIETGKEIEIEERDESEVTEIEGVRIAPHGIQVYNPAFDVTPYQNITGIITEKKVYFQENGEFNLE
ncbi:MAG: S-methyl-5-thioribose-1-phosphate isomerase [Tissierellia bacterium]|nr:S-methyl-5-thioribose-1-phosphate isomerase [Tissierellia bacterium]